MQELKKAIIDSKEDIWKIPEDSHIIYVNCALEHYAAIELIEKCRELQELVFSGPAYALTGDETKRFLEENVFLTIASAVRSHGVKEELADKIKQLYASGHYTLDRLSKEFGISEHTLLHVIHDKPPVYVKRKGKKGGKSKEK